MQIIRCIVLEDEEPAQNLLRHYFKRMPEVELVAVFDNALEVSDFLENNAVDLIITDIEMPRLTGLDFIRMLSAKYQIIVITAYPQYASESYDLDVVDYIKKPASFERFQKAIDKVKQLLQMSVHENSSVESFLYVKDAGKIIKISFEDIIYVEGFGDYVKVITKEGLIMTLSTLTKIMETLPPQTFIRVHKSFIINTNKIHIIDSANSLVVLNDKTEITLGRAFKQEFMARFKSIN